MTNYRELPGDHLSTASGEDLKVEGMGDLVVGSRSDSEQKPGTTMTQIIQLNDVLYVAGLTSNLLSLRAMALMISSLMRRDSTSLSVVVSFGFH